MVTLVEPPFRTPSMTPNPSVIRPISLAISWFSAVGSPSCTTNDQKTSKKAKNSLDVWSTFGLASSHVSGDLSTSRCSGACLLTFPLFGPSKGIIKECTSPLDLEDKWKLMCSSDYFLGSKTFSFCLFFLEATRVFAEKPTLPFSPFFRVMREGVFHEPSSLCSGLPHLSLLYFF